MSDMTDQVSTSFESGQWSAAVAGGGPLPDVPCAIRPGVASVTAITAAAASGGNTMPCIDHEAGHPPAHGQPVAGTAAAEIFCAAWFCIPSSTRHHCCQHESFAPEFWQANCPQLAARRHQQLRCWDAGHASGKQLQSPTFESVNLTNLLLENNQVQRAVELLHRACALDE